MGQLALSGVVVVGPALKAGTFPAAEITIALVSKMNDYVISASGLMNIASVSSYVPLPVVGTNGPVTKGTFLYVKTNAPISLRMTTVDGVSTAVAVEPLDGLKVHEFPDGSELVLLEAEGTATVEFLVAGQS